MSLQTNCSRFCAVETLPIFRFVSDDTIGLEASSCVAFTIEKEKKRMQFENDLTNRTQLLWWNWFVEKNKKANLENYLPNSMLSYKCYVL